MSTPRHSLTRPARRATLEPPQAFSRPATWAAILLLLASAFALMAITFVFFVPA